MNIFVSNLKFSINEGQLKAMFQEFGEVKSVKIIKDRTTGKSRGFGFVEMEYKDEAQEAIAQLNDSDQEGRTIKVVEARPKEVNGNRV